MPTIRQPGADPIQSLMGLTNELNYPTIERSSDDRLSLIQHSFSMQLQSAVSAMAQEFRRHVGSAGGSAAASSCPSDAPSAGSGNVHEAQERTANDAPLPPPTEAPPPPPTQDAIMSVDSEARAEEPTPDVLSFAGSEKRRGSMYDQSPVDTFKLRSSRA